MNHQNIEGCSAQLLCGSYEPPGIVADVEFRAGDTRHYVEVEILYDGVREMREAFTVHLKPDENMVAEIQVGVRNSHKLPVFMEALPLSSHYKGMFSVTFLSHIVYQTDRRIELKVKSKVKSTVKSKIETLKRILIFWCTNISSVLLFALCDFYLK